MKFTCPHCGQSLEMKDTLSSYAVDCPECGGEVAVPGLSEEDADQTLAAGATQIDSKDPDQTLPAGGSSPAPKRPARVYSSDESVG